MTNTEVTLTEFGETRDVALRVAPAGHIAHTGSIFVSTIGRGGARYPASLDLWAVDDDHPAYRNNTVVTASDGTRWQYHLGTVTRNRQAQIVGWADTAGVTNEHDQTRTATS